MKTEHKITEYFAEVETTQEYKGYFCSVGETLTIVILGSLCDLRNVKQINQWALDERVSEFLRDYMGIKKVPCYYWMLCLLKIIDPKSLNLCFMNWVQSMLPETLAGFTLSMDGKAIRSTGKMEKYDSPMHIVSAHIAELGMTFGQQTVYDKSNEIPAVQELIGMLRIKGCIVVADALNCQKATAKAIIDAKADYLLSVKDNQKTLKEDIETYVQDDELRQDMDTFTTIEKNGGRIERRTAYVTSDIAWLYGKDDWVNLAVIGAVHTRFTPLTGPNANVTTNEWHYYISSRRLTAEELLRHARLEWSVESMHWLLDVHFDEDFCRVEDKYVQQNLNIIRKIALNSVKRFKEASKSKLYLTNIMFGFLMNPAKLLPLLTLAEN